MTSSQEPFSKFVLRQDFQIETRTAVIQDPDFTGAIEETCKSIPGLRACYLLDARRSDWPEIALFFALLVDDPSSQMDEAAARIQRMLTRFPGHAKRSFIVSAEGKVDAAKDRAFYVRK
jgi:hypothetical protein